MDDEQQRQVFYGHYMGQPMLGGTQVKNWSMNFKYKSHTRRLGQQQARSEI